MGVYHLLGIFFLEVAVISSGLWMNSKFPDFSPWVWGALPVAFVGVAFLFFHIEGWRSQRKAEKEAGKTGIQQRAENEKLQPLLRLITTDKNFFQGKMRDVYLSEETTKFYQEKHNNLYWKLDQLGFDLPTW